MMYNKNTPQQQNTQKKTVSEVNRFFHHNLPHKFRIQEWITTPSQHHCWRHGPKTKTGHHWSRVHHWPCQVNQVVHGKAPNLVEVWKSAEELVDQLVHPKVFEFHLGVLGRFPSLINSFQTLRIQVKFQTSWRLAVCRMMMTLVFQGHLLMVGGMTRGT